MNNPIIRAIETRVSANHFDPEKAVPEGLVEELARLATRAPTAYNLQNWRFIAVRSSEAKARLQAAAYGQAKVSEAAVTFIVCGLLPSHADLDDRLRPSVDAGFMPKETVAAWTKAAENDFRDNPQRLRDEAVRSATLGAAFLMFAAEAHELVSGPMIGFDPLAVESGFGLAANEVPVLLVAVGYPGGGNWPQKPRLPVSRILETV